MWEINIAAVFSTVLLRCSGRARELQSLLRREVEKMTAFNILSVNTKSEVCVRGRGKPEDRAGKNAMNKFEEIGQKQNT